MGATIPPNRNDNEGGWETFLIALIIAELLFCIWLF